VVQSHLVQHSFVKDYTILAFHGKADLDVSAGASGGNSSTSTTAVTAEHDGGQQPSSSSAAAGGHDTAAGDNANHDYITMDDLLQDMADDSSGGGDGDGEQAAMMEPEDAKLFEEIANHLNHDDVLFGSPRWLENFKEIKQAAIDPLYKDCPKQ
jgi:hypothetical protein